MRQPLQSDNSRGESGAVGVLELILIALVVGVIGLALFRANQSANLTSKQPQPTPRASAPTDTIEYSNQELGLSFIYPKSWGQVKLTAESAYKGKGYRIGFTSNQQSQGTIRSIDFDLAAPGSGRGGAYWDAPTKFSSSWGGDKTYDPNNIENAMLLEKTETFIIWAYCSDFTASAGIDALIKLNGPTYDTVKFYYLVRQPAADGSGADLTGCDDLKHLVAPVLQPYQTFIKTVKPQ